MQIAVLEPLDVPCFVGRNFSLQVGRFGAGRGAL